MMLEREIVSLKCRARVTHLLQHDTHIQQQLCIRGCQMQCLAVDMQCLLLPAQVT